MLTKAQKHEVLELLAESLEGRISSDGKRLLRAYVAHELPRLARASWQEIEDTASYMVGVWDISGSLDAPEAEA
jgi:hypothetical protein